MPRSLDRRATVTLLLVGLVVAAGLGLVVVKARERAALRALVGADARGAGSAGDVQPITDEERTLWAQLDERLRRRYPAEAELPRTMAALAEWSRASGLELVSVDVQAPPATGPATPAAPASATPSAPAAVPGVTVPAELVLNGARVRIVVRHRYRDLVKFVDGLGRLPVYVALQSLETRRTDDALTTEMSFLTLRWGA